jgi:hypothetical protein
LVVSDVSLIIITDLILVTTYGRCGANVAPHRPAPRSSATF